MSFTLEEIGSPLESLPGELWRYVQDTGDRYCISTLGRLMTTGYKGGKAHIIMKPARDPRGYMKTIIIRNGKNASISIHRLVAQAFIPNPNNWPQVNHIDYNPSNNRLENLEWCTAKMNMRHSKPRMAHVGYQKGVVHQNSCQGSRVWNAKLNESQVEEIRKKFKPYVYTRQMLADEYRVSPATIKDIILRTWRHVK